MDLSTFLTANIFVHIALAFYVAGFLTRNELILRALILSGTMFYILYYYFISDTPLWDAILASSIIGLANLLMITIILFERSTLGMSVEMRALFRHFETMNPGQFRRIMRAANWITAPGKTILSEVGTPINHLYFITKGPVFLKRGGRETAIPEGNFIGEISFLVGGPASATVVAEAETEYVVWDTEALRRVIDGAPALSNALSALFNKDIAKKLAISSPDGHPPVAPDTRPGDRLH